MRDVIAARHSNENTLPFRMGFALVICIFVSLTWAVPTLGHNILFLQGGESIHFTGNPFDKEDETENWQNYEEWADFIANHPDPEYRTDHWHFEPEIDQIGSWAPCMAEGYNKEKNSYSECSDGNNGNNNGFWWRQTMTGA